VAGKSPTLQDWLKPSGRRDPVDDQGEDGGGLRRPQAGLGGGTGGLQTPQTLRLPVETRSKLGGAVIRENVVADKANAT
jgi:hypothetical protein